MITIEILRELRVGGYAVFDFVVSFLGIYILSPLLTGFFRKFSIEIPKQNWLFLTLPMSIVVHLLIGQTTQMTGDFIDFGGHYILKILIIVMIILGLRGIKRIK